MIESIPIGRAWRACSNELKNVRNGQGEPELQRDAMETMFRQRPSTVFGEEPSDLGVIVFEVTYEVS